MEEGWTWEMWGVSRKKTEWSNPGREAGGQVTVSEHGSDRLPYGGLETDDCDSAGETCRAVFIHPPPSFLPQITCTWCSTYSVYKVVHRATRLFVGDKCILLLWPTVRVPSPFLAMR